MPAAQSRVQKDKPAQKPKRGLFEGRRSRIFGNLEMEYLDIHLAGSRKDPHGTFAARVKPKIRELLDTWFPKRRQLEKVVEVKKR